MKNLIKKLTSQGAIFGLGAASNSIAGVILIPFYIQNLSAAEYGIFALYEMALLVLLVIFGLGLNITLLSQWHKISEDDKNRLAGGLVSCVLVSCVIGGILLAALATLVLPGIDWRLFDAIIFIILFEVVWLILSTIYRAEAKVWRFVISSFVRFASGVLLTVLLIKYLGFREDGILYGRLLGDLVLLISSAPILLRYRPRIDLSPALRLIKMGIPLIPASLSVILILMMPRFLLEVFASTRDVGIFVMSAKIAGLVSLFFVQPFSMSWMPQLFVVHGQADAKKVYSKIFTYYVALGGLIAASIVLLSPSIVALLNANEFPLSEPAISILALAFIVSGMIYPINIGPYVLEETRRVLPAFFGALIAMLVVGAALAQPFGVVGVSVALLAAYLVQVGGLYRISQSMYPIRYEWMQILQIIFVLGASTFVAYQFERITSWWLSSLFVFLVLAYIGLRVFPVFSAASQVRSGSADGR